MRVTGAPQIPADDDVAAFWVPDPGHRLAGVRLRPDVPVDGGQPDFRPSGDDRRKYRDKLQRSLDVFDRMLRESRFEDDPARVGLEIELNLVDPDGEPSMCNAVVLAAIADPAWATELGQFNLEINVPPRQLDGDSLAELETEVRASLNAADGKARSTGSRLVMVGILPTLAEDLMNEETLSANERYRVLNEQIFAARGENIRIEIDGAEQLLTYADSITPEAACTSLQLHVQVSPEAFASYWNAAQAIAGVQVALAANSPFLLAGSCGRKPGSRCSSRPPTPGRPSCSTRVCGRGSGSASAGSPQCSTCSRRTSGSSRRCCPSARTRIRWPNSTAAAARNWPR